MLRIARKDNFEKDKLMNDTQQHRINLEAAQVNDQGEFEILAITAGDGNGWKFSADSLQRSIPLWDGIQTFIDHHWFGNSVHDLAGVCHSPAWDEQSQGIKLQLRPIGPAAPVLVEMGKQILTLEKSSRPDVGFSADISFSAKGKDVQEILRVFSVDLVVNPARGGEFIRQIYQKFQKSGKESTNMANPETEKLSTQTPTQETLPGVERVQQRIESDKKAVETLLNVQGKIAELEGEAEKARALRVQMCGQFLESALAAAKLPAPVDERLRKQFAGKLFEAEELTAAIEDARAMLSELTGASVVQGARIHSVFDTRDKLQAAADDLLGAPRDKQLEGLNVAKLSGIRELYLMLTGDYDLHGGYDPQRAQFATTADFTGLVKNALNKIVVNTWELLGKPVMTGGTASCASSTSTRCSPSPARWSARSDPCRSWPKAAITPNWPSVTAPRRPTS